MSSSAHPLEKSSLGYVDTSIHRLCSAEVWIRWRGNNIIIAEWMARSC
jgi:hypothetical protein